MTWCWATSTEAASTTFFLSMRRDLESDPWEKLATLRWLATRHHCARFHYFKFREGRSTRVIEPYAVSVTENGHFIILGWQIHPAITETEYWRNFRLDRIAGIEDAGLTFVPRMEIDFPEDNIPIFIMPTFE